MSEESFASSHSKPLTRRWPTVTVVNSSSSPAGKVSAPSTLTVGSVARALPGERA